MRKKTSISKYVFPRLPLIFFKHICDCTQKQAKTMRVERQREVDTNTDMEVVIKGIDNNRI